MSGPIPMSLTAPYTFDDPLDVDDARRALKLCANNRKQAREWLQRALQEVADAEQRYRKARSEAWVLHPDGVAKQREDDVNYATAQARHERDVAAGIVKAALERIAEVDGERASLHRLIEWSMKVDPHASEQRERETFGATA